MGKWVVGLIVFVTACVHAARFSPGDASYDQFNRDQAECRNEALSYGNGARGAVVVGYTPHYATVTPTENRRAEVIYYNNCMQAKGYQVASN